LPSSRRTWPTRFADGLLRLYPAAEVAAAVRAKAAEPAALAAVRRDPAAAFRARGWEPDPWQAEYLRASHPRTLMLCCRRAGKSVVSAARTLAHCLTTPDALCMVFSPTARQSIEYARYVRAFDKALGFPVRVERRNQTVVEWANGARLMSLPDSHEGVVGFTPTRVVIDEASRVSDVLYLSLRPMLALGAELELLSTPFGKRGFFFSIFDTPARLRQFAAWRVTADRCPRITRRFLEEEKLELGERWFQQEYFLEFVDAVDAVFTQAVIRAAIGGTHGPLFPLG
jgi:hypothetical protein